MNTRDKILAAIQKAKPEEVPLPEIVTSTRYPAPVEQFIAVLQAIGGTVMQVEGLEDVVNFVSALCKSDCIVVNSVAALGAVTIAPYANANAAAIEKVHTVILEGVIGVAENGAVWLPESALTNRLLPFLCQHLVLVLNQKNIVHSMHQAYATIRAGAEGYGVFIAGPSKTADIEQSLVLGAHGPLSMQVLLVKDGII